MTSFDFHPPAAHAAVEWALAYARVAMAVFPCGADSRPLVERGFKNATTNPGQIRAWWKRWPHAEIGWAVPGGVVVVDLDVKKGKRGLEDFSGVSASSLTASRRRSRSRHRAAGTSSSTTAGAPTATSPRSLRGQASTFASAGSATSCWRARTTGDGGSSRCRRRLRRHRHGCR